MFSVIISLHRFPKPFFSVSSDKRKKSPNSNIILFIDIPENSNKAYIKVFPFFFFFERMGCFIRLISKIDTISCTCFSLWYCTCVRRTEFSASTQVRVWNCSVRMVSQTLHCCRAPRGVIMEEEVLNDVI